MFTVKRQALTEFHFTLRSLPGETPSALMERLAALLQQHQASVVRHEVFGSLGAHAEAMETLKRKCGGIEWPVTWVQGHDCAGQAIAGMHVMAVAGVPVDTLRLGKQVVGRIFNDGRARNCLLGNLLPADISACGELQAWQAFERIEQAVGLAGMNITHVARTWLFIDDILSWYGPFNIARKKYFEHRKLLGGFVPSSTGVGAGNLAGAALVAGAWAVLPGDGPFAMREVFSPLQCPAPNYGSCFSRAVELATPGLQRVMVSGTASIEPGGETARVNDPAGQIDLTMEVVEAILASRNLSFADITRATAYFKEIKDAPLFDAWCRKNEITLPCLSVQAFVCRDDLLFEIEMDAMADPRALGNTRACSFRRARTG